MYARCLGGVSRGRSIGQYDCVGYSASHFFLDEAYLVLSQCCDSWFTVSINIFKLTGDVCLHVQNSAMSRKNTDERENVSEAKPVVLAKVHTTTRILVVDSIASYHRCQTPQSLNRSDACDPSVCVENFLVADHLTPIMSRFPPTYLFNFGTAPSNAYPCLHGPHNHVHTN